MQQPITYKYSYGTHEFGYTWRGTTYLNNSITFTWGLFALIALIVICIYAAMLMTVLIVMFDSIQSYTEEKCKKSGIGTYILFSLLYIIHGLTNEKNVTNQEEITNADINTTKTMVRSVTELKLCDLSVILYFINICWGVLELSNECVLNNMKKGFFIAGVLIVAVNLISLIGTLISKYPNIFYKNTRIIVYI